MAVVNRSRCWVWTLNNYTLQDIRTIRTFATQDRVNYILYGKEVGENNTPHLQGYIELKNAMTISALNRQLGNRCWIGARQGTQQQAIDYIKNNPEKPEPDIWEYGQPRITNPRDRGSGKFGPIKRDILDGVSWTDIRESYPGHCIRYGRAIKEWIKDVADTKRRK